MSISSRGLRRARCSLFAFRWTLVLAAASSPRAEALTAEEWAQAYSQRSLAGAGADVSGHELTYGHLVLRFENGRLYPVLAGGQLCGAFFEGSGAFRYTSTDSFESATYRHDVAHATHYEVAPDGSFGDSFQNVLVMLSAGNDSLAGSSNWTSGNPPGDAVLHFQEHVERRKKDNVRSATQLLILARLESAPAPVIAAEIDARRHDLLYLRDPVHRGDETLESLHPSESDIEPLKDKRFPDLLSSQPLTYKRLEPRPRRYRLTDVDLTLLNREGLRAELTVRETFEALVPLRTIDLELWNKIVGEVGQFGHVAFKQYTLTSVTDAAGAKLSFAHEEGALIVQLPRVLSTGDRVELHFEVTGDVLFRPNNDNFWWLAQEGWFPVPPRFSMEAFTYHAVCKVPKPFVSFSCGRTERRWEEGDLACAEFRETKPIQYAVILAGKYTTYTEVHDDLTVRVSCYAMAKEDAMKKLARLAFSFIELYKPLLPEYPFAELNIVEVNSYGFGIAPAGLIFFTKEAFEPMQPVANLFVDGVNQRFAHEIAHAWWGHVAQLSDPEDEWLSESTADYYAAFAMSAKSKGEFESALRLWTRGAKETSDAGSVFMANFLAGKNGERDRNNLLYGKGPLVLHELRREIGDDNMFFTILKSFVRSFYLKPAYTKDFIGITNFITKKDYRPFFDRYLFGTAPLPAK